MITTQTYTNLEQAQNLFSLLGHGHFADMMYTWEYEGETGWEGYEESLGWYDEYDHSGYISDKHPDIPCWSLQGLVGLLPKSRSSIVATYDLTLLPGTHESKAGYIDSGEYYEVYHIEKGNDLLTAVYNLVLWSIKEGII